MLELPQRESEIAVDVALRTEEGWQPVRLYMEPLTDAQAFRVIETAGTGEEGGTVYRASQIPGLFEDRFRRMEPVLQVDGAPFDPRIPAHAARVPVTWKQAAFKHLIHYALGLTEAERGNSEARGRSSSTGETPSPDSPPVSDASS